ncbi:hypothetical protein BT96DRAFT_932310 [Gymnopus androsaceus JB14]|uniref:Uncharacterized protein n=1 Tax=Gymnopus androsaceus JB14 TaxID=1447944 RepID=A0A6A4IGC0_9AGAR|nr:hypothetical protein BT96DRAFT_932310 [Gymnopus androsaceus JB14]
MVSHWFFIDILSVLIKTLSMWYQDKELKTEDIPSVTFNNKVQPLDARLGTLCLPAVNYSNPFKTVATPPPQTQTLGARAVHEEATAALRPLLSCLKACVISARITGAIKGPSQGGGARAGGLRKAPKHSYKQLKLDKAGIKGGFDNDNDGNPHPVKRQRVTR